MSVQPYGIHWFRRDLRIAGNPALLWHWKKHEGRVLGLFSFDRKFLEREDFSHNRFAFFLATLKDLKDQLSKSGGDLLFLDDGPEKAFEKLFSKLKAAGNSLPTSVSFNRDYEPFAVKRDAQLEKLFRSHNIEVHSERDHLLIEPQEITKEGVHSFYQVYSPFQRAWTKKFQTETIQNRILSQKRGLKFLKDFEQDKQDSDLFKLSWKSLLPALRNDTVLEDYEKKTLAKVDIQIPRAGSLQALSKAREFHRKHISQYSHERDIPSHAGTSQMSIFLKNGSITTAQLISICGLEDLSHPKYLNELIWREFYYHILAHRPDVETCAFQAKYDQLKWENREDLFVAWKNGVTGYPIVDAGMRQLNQTGWMHNRVRMIVASFLTKDLLIDYRWGENYFMKKLLDGDLAPNNGGWQWAASTGCDPQPYFRIFNPVLQSQRFDPDGTYIRRFVPELKDFDAKEIHEPWDSSKISVYPKRVVIHAEQKNKALELFKSANKTKS
jgi:deoxyribodipyrimidine photo-lyase